MKVGLIDVDGHNFPNIPLMKISAYHKIQGDSVQMIHGFTDEHFDKVYMSKVFSFTDDYDYILNADEIVRGGSGYAIHLENGKEVYDKSKDIDLPYEIEHVYPDYSLYPELTKDTAYGFLSRGCPRGCRFCHVEAKEGRKSYKVADLSEFWNGQKKIMLCDPNILACKEWKDLLGQLAESKSKVNFNQGLDVRLATPEKIEVINKIRLTKTTHLAWDNPGQDLTDHFKRWQELFRRKTGTVVYVLVNFNSTLEQDLYRIYTLMDLGFDPYVMIYDKAHADKQMKRLGRWCNNKIIFKSTKTFEEYR